ncbi:C13orf22-like [Sigmodon hispidus]
MNQRICLQGYLSFYFSLVPRGNHQQSCPVVTWCCKDPGALRGNPSFLSDEAEKGGLPLDPSLSLGPESQAVEQYSSQTAEELRSQMTTDEDPLSTANTSEDPLTTIHTDEDPLTTAHTDEDPLTTAHTDEDPLTTIHTDEDPLTTAHTDEDPLTTAHTRMRIH